MFPNCLVKLVEWREGLARILVPDPSHYGHPNHMPVFFNPRARVSRDVSALVLSTLDVREVLDAMAATGIRGIRYALEAGKGVVFNDIDPKATELVRKNIYLNGVDADVIREDANILMHSRTFQAIDLDPFGSPAPFLHAAARSVAHRGVLLVTATDTAPLFGSAPNAAKRKYLALVGTPPWRREMGVRILLANIFHALGVWEKGFVPILSFVHEHHVRVIVRVYRRPSLVTENARRIGITRWGGPLWLGPLHDPITVKRALNAWSDVYSKESQKILHLALQELDVVGYYDIHALAREHRLRRLPPIESILEALRERGFRASRTVFSPTGVKTDAGEEELVAVLRGLAENAP